MVVMAMVPSSASIRYSSLVRGLEGDWWTLRIGRLEPFTVDVRTVGLMGLEF
jgi:hypothetical protein